MRHVILVLAVAVVAAGCDRSTPPEPAANNRSDSYLDVHAALCTALNRATENDLASARTMFVDDAHNVLHDLARDVEAIDRSFSARLLEAKQRVEADFTTLSPNTVVDLDELIDSVEVAVVALDQATPAPCT